MAPAKRKNTVAATNSKKMKTSEWADIKKEIMHADAPAEVRDMLIEILPFSLGEFADRRHKYQEQMVSALDVMLKDIESSKKNYATKLQADLENSNEQKIEKEKATEEANRQKDTKTQEVHEKMVSLAASALKFRVARDGKEKADNDKRLGQVEFSKAESRKAQFLGMMEDLDILRNTTPDATMTSAKSESLISMMKKYDFEESLQIALPSVFAKPPDARGKFDSVALDGLAAAIQKRIEEQEKIIIAAAPSNEKNDAAVAVAQEALKAATTSQLLAARAYEEAAKALKACEEETKLAEKAAKEEKTAATKLGKMLTSAEAELEVFRDGPRANFTRLMQRIEPVVEEVVIAMQEPVTERGPGNEEEPTKIVEDVTEVEQAKDSEDVVA